MTLYDTIYNYLLGNLFTNTQLDFATTVGNLTFNEWLAHSLTITGLILFLVIACLFIRWIFKVVSGLILLK